ncbi:MAG: hypothetical protein IKT70_02620 [Clostridia bacterium]|nr:hypothetical protein [Clostridia bacterium]
MTKKITAIIITLLLIIPFVLGCASEEVQVFSPRPADTVLGNVRYSGNIISVLVSDRSANVCNDDIFSAELFGETLSTEGLYVREAIESELGVELQYVSVPSVYTALTEDTAADTKGYSIAYPTLSEFSAGVIDGLFVNLNSVSADAFMADYFDDRFRDAVTFNGKTYAVLESGSVSALRGSFVTFASPEVLGESLTSRLKTLVLDGSYTIDAQNAIVAEAGSVTDDKIVYGLGSDREICSDVYFSAFDLSVTKCDGDGRLILTESTDILESAYEKIHDLIIINPHTYISENEDDGSSLANMFSTGNLAMTTLEVKYAEKDEIGDNYIILPLPKYSEEQNKYGTYSADFTPAVIPIGAPDYLCAATVLEGIAAKQKKYTAVPYLDLVTDGMYSKSAETARLTDLALSVRIFDTAIIYSVFFENASELIFRYPLAEGKSSNRGTAMLSLKAIQRVIPDFDRLFE